MKHDLYPQLLSALKNANSILLCTHISPDGDAVGSTLAMGLGLKKLGKNVVMACADEVPEIYGFLPCAEEFKTAEQLNGLSFDTALAIDVSALHRLGAVSDAFFSAKMKLQIDHHPDNPDYADINVVDGKMPAAGVLVKYFLDALSVPLDPEIAACLYCALSTDTGNFCFSNTNAAAFSVMADLMNAGLDLSSIARRLHLLHKEAHLRLLGRVLNSLKIFQDGALAGMTLTQEDYRAAQAHSEHREGIVNYALNIPGIKMAYLIEEMADGNVKASLRSVPPLDVSAVARQFGGGGHAQAAAFQCEGTLFEVRSALEEALIHACEGMQ